MRNIRTAPGVVVTVLAWVVPLAACGTEPAGTEKSGGARVTVGAHPSPSDNGIAAKTPREAVAAARQALAAAKSVHMHGSLWMPGEEGPFWIDMWYSTDGSRGTVKSRENGTTGKWMTLETLQVGARRYIRGGSMGPFMPPEVAARIKDRWVIMTEPQVPRDLVPPEMGGPGDPAGPPPAGADGSAAPPPAVPSEPAEREDIASLAGRFRPEDAVSSTGRTTTGGLPAVGIRLKPPSSADEGNMIVYIAATGTPRILRQEIPGNRRYGIDFTEYDVPFTLSAPSDAVDLETLMR